MIDKSTATIGNPSGMCAKLRTVATSNNRDHAGNLPYYCLLAQNILWCYSSCTSRSWWITHQHNATREVATTSPPFYNKPHWSHVLCAKAELGTTSTSWSQHHFVAIGNPSGMCAKLHTVAASNNRDHIRNLSYYCLLALHILWCYSSRTSCSWWITQSTQRHQRGCNTTVQQEIKIHKYVSHFHTKKIFIMISLPSKFLSE